jgi:uncharacterized protein (TIGR02284 family)
MTTMTDTLKQLVETAENGERGYAEGAQKLQKDGHPDLAGIFERFSNQRATLAKELRTLDPNIGTTADAKGSLPGALHRGWLALKDAFDGSSPHGVLDAAEQGEDHAVSVFRDALDGDLAEPARSVVARHLTAIQQAHDEIKRLRNQN